MDKNEFCKSLEQECMDSNNISFSITTAKGLITLFWSLTYSQKTNAQAFEAYYDEINWANMKMDYLAKKYSTILIHQKKLKDTDAEHFDRVFRVTKQPPVKKGMETDTQSMGGFVQFKNIKEI